MGCSNGDFHPTFCDIVDTKTLQCQPTDPTKPVHDIKIIDALAYRCVSPSDWEEAKKRLRTFLEVESQYPVPTMRSEGYE